MEGPAQWKAQLLERAAEVFEGGARSTEPPVGYRNPERVAISVYFPCGGLQTLGISDIGRILVRNA